MAPPKKSSRPDKTQTKLSSFFTPKTKASTSSETPRVAEKRPAPEEKYDDVWDSPIKSSVAKKRQRIILSDDDEENIESTPTTPKSTASNRTPLTPRFQNLKSPRGTAGKLSSSYINSFRYDESDVNSEFGDGQSSTVTTPSRTPAKKIKSKINEMEDDETDGGMLHLTFEFLKPGKVRDAEGRLESHPDYNPHTLFVPADFMRNQSPGHQQWWTFKSQNYDTVLFHKVGKFYEMYHMDAVVGVENLNLAFMRGKYAHCGFPEMAFGNFAEKLVRKGFKVARIEQTETPSQLEERTKTEKTKEKVVRRELCRILTQATQTYSSFDSPAEDGVNTGAADSTYLLSICEKKNTEGGVTKIRIGVSFVDCATGQFYLCDFIDDTSFSTLRTLLAHNQPTQILQPRNGLSQLTQAVLNSILGPVQKEELQQKKEFLPANEALKLLLDNEYLGSDIRAWPETLIQLVADPDEPIPKAKPEHELALNAFGGILWYLRRCLIDVDLVTMKKFEIYTPTTTVQNIKNLPGSDRWTGRRMVLDGFALKSLHLLPPNDSLSHTRTVDADSQRFSLFNTVNRCSTPFGRRMLRQWICAPSCDPNILHKRQETIQFLCNPEHKNLMEVGKDLLKKIPDLERLFQRIHSLGLKYRSEKHPDSRAHFFEAARYNTRKVRDLCVTLAGLEQLQKLIAFFEKNYKDSVNCPSLLRNLLSNKYTDMETDLEHFDALIPDREKVAKEGRILPKMDPDYNQAVKNVADGEKALDQYLHDQQKQFKSSKLAYTGTGKNRYQLEIPEELTDDLDSEYELRSKRKGFKRYQTPKLESLIQNLSELEKQRDYLTDDSTRRIFADFDARKEKWAQIVSQIATFDCLLSLALYSSESSLQMCVPEFDFESDQPYLEIREGYHPSLASGSGVLASSEYIPNDVILGGDSIAPVLLLTGANMGGKSTLMRQTAVLVVLAQIGSLVPAKKMRLTPVDRVFSRIGASDCIAAGQSTFYIELNETNVILREATRHSLVIIDELGRGTATFDGTAIATAVLKNLAEKLKCRTIFSTHYHSLCNKFSDNPEVALGHMKCLVENDNIDGDPSMDNITFLYTLVDGACPKSYGFFTARMAGIDQELVRRAFNASKMIETNEEGCLQKLRKLSSDLKSNQMTDTELLTAINTN